MEAGCGRPKTKGRHRCAWHYLLTQPIEVQERQAQLRLARVPEEQHRARVPEREWPDGERWCAGCQSFVPLFYARGSRCRACASRATHRGAVERKYLWPPGMDYDRLLALQGGRCAICRCTPRTRRLAVDHDHQSGYVRGLLCSASEGASCNKGLLGSAHDSVDILLSAVMYLVRPPSGADGQVPSDDEGASGPEPASPFGDVPPF